MDSGEQPADSALTLSLTQDVVNNQLISLPVLGDLRRDCMRDRHWEGVVALCGAATVDAAHLDRLAMRDLTALRLHEYVEDIGGIVDRADKEQKIEKNLTMLSQTWKGQKFLFHQHKETEVQLVRISEETLELLEDNQVLVGNMVASRFVAQFQEQVTTWQAHLSTVAEVLGILTEIQRTWAYLEELFIGSDEVRRELPEDADRFVKIDTAVKNILAGCKKTPVLVKRCNADGLFQDLEAQQHQLELCEKALMDFMEAKRKAFPRFYFVSTKDLLDILSNGSHPELVMPHIPKIFQFIQRLDLKTPIVDEDKAQAAAKKGKPLAVEPSTALGMYSHQEEYVPFNIPCLLNGKVEMWLQRVIDAMRSSVHFPPLSYFIFYFNLLSLFSNNIF
jgi:dynein heavy chain